MQTELDTADGRLDSIDSALDTIGARLDDIDGQEGDIAGLDTRVASIETSLANDRLDNIDSAISDIQEEISDAHGSYNSLDARLDNIEQSINNSSSGSSNTEVIDNATFAQDGTPILPNSATPDPTIDYLIKDTSNKYYYWKYINNTWELISGGSGNGSSSAIIASALPLAAEADENIDYYIGNNILGYTHYRYVPSSTPGEDGAFITILPKKLTDNLDNLINAVGVGEITVTTIDATTEEPAITSTMSGDIQAYAINDTSHEHNLYADFTALRYARIKRTYDGETLTKQELIFTYTDGTEMAPIEIVGGSGGAGSLYSVRLVNALPSLNVTTPTSNTGAVNISARAIVNYGATLAENVDINATIQYKLSNSNTWQNADAIVIPTITNGTVFNIDVSSLLGGAGTTTNVRLRINTQPEGDEGEIYTQSITYNISKVAMSIESINYNPATIRTGASFMFDYRCRGENLAKVVIFKIDNNIVATNNIPATADTNAILHQTLSLNDLTSGMHTLEVYFTAAGATSNILNYYLICNKDSERTAPLIGVAVANTDVNYIEGPTINYTAYTPGQNNTDEVEIVAYTLGANEEENIISSSIQTNVQNSTVMQYTITDCPEPEEGTDDYTLYIRVTAKKNISQDSSLTDSQTISVTVHTYDSGYELKYAGLDNLIYQYVANGHTNNDSDKDIYNYTYVAHDSNNTPITFETDFDRFNWSTNGYSGRSITTTDEDTGETITTRIYDALTISGGATQTINVPIFQSKVNGISIESDADNLTDPTQNGRTIEIDYLVRSATDLNDVIISCMNAVTNEDINGNTVVSGAGFQITPQNCYLLNSNVGAVKDDTGTILNEDAIAAAYLTTGTRIHLAFVIEPWAVDKAYDQKYHQSVNIYINGEFANACPYNRDNSTGTTLINSFSTDAVIRIGSPSCIIDLFSVKLYNRGLTDTEILQNYKMSPAALTDKITRFEKNNVIRNGVVNYELARKKFNCLLLVGPEPDWKYNDNNQRYNAKPTISPYKGSPSPIGRLKDGKVEGKTESGLIFTIPKNDADHPDGYQEEFKLLDKLTDGGYASSNNVQGTSSQKYPIHNLKIYLAKGRAGTEELDPETGEIIAYGKSDKVKYKLPEQGIRGKGESTLCWKADYMSTDHANTFNANIADSLFTDPMDSSWADDWRNKLQYTVHGVRCLLFQQMGNQPPEFVADGCLNNDKGNSKTYGLEYPVPDDPEAIDPTAEYDVDGTADTVAQKWEFTNNSDDLGFFKYDSLLLPIGNDQHVRALDAFESCYPDQGDLGDAQDAYKAAHDNAEDPNLNPNYNHLQIVSSWVSQRANYWNETDPNLRAEKKAIFKSEFTKHFILDHVLVYYLFSEYVALCDNRVKNMFLRSDNVRKEHILLKNGDTLFEGNNNPNAAFFKNFTQIDTGVLDENNNPVYGYNVSNIDDIDWENSSFATWAPVLYDLDSCFGVENVGLLKIPYNADWQYYQNGQYLFNGHDSVFWLMFEDSFDTEIRAKATTLYDRQRGLNYNTFYQEQIVDNNNQIAPAMTNQDMILKYDVPWATGFMNYEKQPPAYETPEYKYIQRGSRATQKASFIFKRSMLLSSKYQTSAFRNNRISMRYGADVAAADAVIKLAGNQIFYPAVSFGDNKGWTQALVLEDGTPVIDGRVNAGEVCRIRATSAAGGQDTLFIAGASVLTDVGDLSVFKAYEINISAATNLRKIAFGSHATGYTNAVTSSIGGLSACALLEEINIENCTNFRNLDLSANGLIKKVYTKGSGIRSVSLPTGGVLDTLELGAETSNITILNQTFLENFDYEDSNINNYSSVNKLWIENTPAVPIVDIVIKRLPNLTEGLRLIGINIDLGSDATFLEMITSEDYAKGKYLSATGSRDTTQYPDITGTVTITTLRRSILNKLNNLYPFLTINVTSQIVEEFALTYKNVDAQGNETELLTLYRTSNESIPDPIESIDNITGNFDIQSAPANQIGYDGQQWVPLRASDAQYIYKFGTYNNTGKYTTYSGWRIKEDGYIRPTSTTSITKNITLIATYPDESRTLQTYNVTWYDDNNNVLLRREGIPYGTDASQYNPPSKYNASNPLTVKKNSNGVYKVFRGWDRPVSIVKGNIDVHSLWDEFNGNFSNFTSINELNSAGLYALSFVDTATRENLLNSRVGNDVKYIKLGRDFEYDSQIETYDLLNGADYHYFDGQVENVIVCDGTNYPAIYPLIDLNKDFTFALDFQFALNSTLWNRSVAEHVIASCFRSTGGSIAGFRIILAINDSQRPQIQVQWGTSSLVIDAVEVDAASDTYISHRNMIVLRHNSTNPNQLTVYYLPPSYKNSNLDPSHYNLQSTITSEPITWASSVAVSAPLILGGNFEGATNNIESTNTRLNATGTIFYAKYWGDDLGNRSCLELAAWPHETVAYKISGYDNGSNTNNQLTIGSNSTNKINFTPAQALGDRTIDHSLLNNLSFTGTSDDLTCGWINSRIRAYMNNIIYNAFPIAYQSLIEKIPITTISQTSSGTGNMATVTGEMQQTEDFLYLPAYYEVDPSLPLGSQYRYEANKPWTWLDVGNIDNVFKKESGYLVQETSINTLNYLRQYYFQKPLLSSARIFHFASNDNPYGQIFIYNDQNVSVQPGDIWYYDTMAYMYVSAEDIQKGVKIDNTKAAGNGGWAPAVVTALRTFNKDIQGVRRHPYNFMKILYNGSISTEMSYGANDTNDRALLPEFSI